MGSGQSQCRKYGLSEDGLTYKSYPSSDRIVPDNVHTLEYYGNKNLSYATIPNSVKKIIFKYYDYVERNGGYPINHFHSYNSSLNKKDLPEFYEYLDLGPQFDQIIEPGVFPDSLKTLVFSPQFNQIIKPGVFPDSLKTLVFGKLFDQEIERNVLPDSLETLIFGSSFNKTIEPGVLPTSLLELRFRGNYNKLFKVGSIPRFVKKLFINSFAGKKSVFIDKPRFTKLIIPSSIEYVRIDGYEYNKDSDNFDQYFTIYT